MHLFRQYFRSELGALFGWGLGVGTLAVLLTAAFAIFTGNVGAELETLIRQMPPQMLRFMGGFVAITQVSGWVQSMLLAGTIPLALTIWTALSVAGIITADRDRGTLEFLLALPVRRSRLLFERWLVFVVQLLLLHTVAWAGALLGLALIGESVDALRLAGGVLLLALAQAAVGGMALVVSLAFRDQTRGVLVVVVAALAFYFLPVFVEPGSASAFLRPLSPFTHSAAAGLMTGAAFPGSAALLLLIWAGAGLALALAVFTRQEV